MGILFDDDPDEPCMRGGCNGHYRIVEIKPCTMRVGREVATGRCDRCGDEHKFVRRIGNVVHA